MAGTREGGLKVAAKMKEKHGADFYVNIGKAGGVVGDKGKTVSTNKALYGEDFYKNIGKLGAEKRKRNSIKKSSKNKVDLIDKKD